MMRPARKITLLLFLTTGLVFAGAAAQSNGQDRGPAPTAGPAAQPGKQIYFLASDMRNGGVSGVFRGAEDAAHHLGWNLHQLDGSGSQDKMGENLREAIASHPDGLILAGFQPADFPLQIEAARQNKIVLVGWHAAEEPGPTDSLFVNVATSAADVGEIAANFVIDDARAHQSKIGVVIVTDDQFAVAKKKTRIMAERISACKGYSGCEVLAVENMPISQAEREIPALVDRLSRKFTDRWTYTLAINDAYFDNINFPLIKANRQDIRNVAAGDGSSKAVDRVRRGNSQQIATIAEPLQMQGYQIMDEMNRALAGKSPSGFQSWPILVTAGMTRTVTEINEGSRAAYWAIWQVR